MQNASSIDPCTFSNDSIFDNDTSLSQQCNNHFFPKSEGNIRDFRTQEDPSITAQEFGNPDFGSNTVDGSSNNNQPIDPTTQSLLDKADSWLRHMNKNQIWNCPVGDVDCTVGGQNSHGSFTCTDFHICDNPQENFETSETESDTQSTEDDGDTSTFGDDTHESFDQKKVNLDLDIKLADGFKIGRAHV